jgi:hypothetical protein
MMQIRDSLQRGEVVDVDRYLTSALKGLLDGTWDLPPAPSKPHKAVKVEPLADVQQWLQLAIARGLIVRLADDASEFVYPACDLETAYPISRLMEMLPLDAISHSEAPISLHSACGLINRLREEKGWPPIATV